MSDMKELTRAASIAVWDPVVRYGHWLLVVGFGVAYLTAEDEGGGTEFVHVWSGYIVGLIVAFRVIWGFVGPVRARFRDFIYGPATSIQYLSELLRGRARRYLGHSPAGGAMVVLLLLSLAATVFTGLVAYGDKGKGPLAGGQIPLVAAAYADEDGHGRQRGPGKRYDPGFESALGEFHDILANVTLALVILHVAGVGLASIVHRENLILAMMNGRKRPES